jgi:hypothetical protein
MAFTTLIMENQYTKETKKAPVGVSWTSLFFSFWVPLFRGHISAMFLWLILFMCSGGLLIIVQGLVYNKSYLKFLINNGYQVKHSPIPLELVASKLKMHLPVVAEK